jgi:prepilin-type N-terminal cleavage/methylation domain-containing protein
MIGATYQISHRVRGLTLIEMVMVIVVLGIIAGLTAPIFSQGLTASKLTAENLQTLETLCYVTERLGREIRQVNHNGAGYDVSSMTATNFAFSKTDTAVTNVTINFSGGNLTLTYSSPPVSGTLADNVTAFSFTYYDASGTVTASTADLAFVAVDFTLQNPVTGASYAQRTRVALRDQS